MTETTKQTLPGERGGQTRKFRIVYVEKVRNEAGELIDEPRELKFYLSFSTYPDGRCGEIFIRAAKGGPHIAGILDGFAKVFSIALQHGAPLKALTGKLRNDIFPPNGFTGDAEFHSCSSMFDLIAQYLDYRFPAGRLCPDAAEHKRLHHAWIDGDPQCPHCFPSAETSA